MSWRIRPAIVAALCALGLSISTANAAIDTWTGASTTFWNNSGNWTNISGAVTPAAGDSLVFSAAGAGTLTNDITGLSVAGLTFDSSAGTFTVGGNAITISGGPVNVPNGNGMENASGNLQTVNLNLSLSTGMHYFTASGAGGLTLNGTITPQSTATVAFNLYGGAIKTTLTNNSTGIIGGWATTSNSTASGTAGSWAINNGSGNIAPLTTFSNTFPGGGTVGGTTSSSNVQFTGGGTLTVPAATAMNTFLLADTTATAVTITVNGTGVANAWTFANGGGIYKNVQTAAVQHLITGGSITAGTSGPATLYIRTLNNSQPAAPGGPPEAISITSTITDNAGGGAVTVVKDGYGVLRLNTANSFTGGLYVNEGQLRPNIANAMGATSSPVYVANGAQVLIGGAVMPNPMFISGIGPIESGFSGGALRLGAASTGVSNTITLTGPARITSRGATATGGTISGQITGSFALELNNDGGTTGTLILSNTSNNWTGDTTISSGTLKPGANEVIPNGAGKGNVVFNGDSANAASTFDLNGFNETINGLFTTGTVTKNVLTNSGTTATITVGDNNATSEFDGQITDAGVGSGKLLNLVKTGSGTLTLGNPSVDNGTFSHNGSTTVNAGTLAIGKNSSLPNSSTISATNTGTFDVSATNALGGSGFTINSNQTLAASSGGLVKGSLTLNGIASGNGGFIGSGSDVLTATGGSSLRPGNSTADGSVGTLNIRNLTSTGSDYRVDASGAGDKIVVSGTADFTGGGTITVASGASASGSPYTILTAGTLTGTPTLPVPTFGRQSYALDFSTANTIKLTVTGGPASVRWTGAGVNSNEWSSSQTANNANWTTTDPVADTTHFYNGDSVTFNDTPGSQYTVNISNTVTPAAISVNTGSSYTFNNGSIAGTGNLVFTGGGTGTLTINTQNSSWSGNTTITAGTLNAAVFQSLGTTGSVTLNSGRLNLGSSGALPGGTFTIGGGTTIDANNGDIISPNANPAMAWGSGFTFVGSFNLDLGTGSITLNGAPTTTVTVSAGKLTATGTIGNGSGNSLAKNGPGTLVVGVAQTTATVPAASTYSGGTTITAGILQAGNFGALGTGNITISGTGTLDLSLMTQANIGGGFGGRTITIEGAGAGGIGALYSASSAQQQNAFSKITLSNDATIGGSGGPTSNANNPGRIDVRNNTPTVTLNGHTLTKSGTNIFDFSTTTVVTLGDIVLTTPALTGSSDPRNILAIESTASIVAGLKPDNVTPYTVTFNNFTGLQLFSLTSTNVTRQMIMNGDVLLANNSTTTSTLVAPIQLNSGAVMKVNLPQNTTTVGNIVLTGNITGPGQIVKQNPTAILTLSGSNSYSGGTTIIHGGVAAGSNTTPLGAGNIGIWGGAPSDPTGGTLDLNGKTVAAGALNDVTFDPGAGPTTSGGTVTNGTTGASTSTLNVGNNNANGAFSGSINNGTTGTIALIKSGSGVQTLSGANNYSGGTTVQGTGKLIVAHVNALGTGGLTISNTATAQLQAGLTAPLQLPSLTISGGVSLPGDLNALVDNISDGLGSTGSVQQDGPLSGGGAAASASVQPVPEPAGFALAGIGIAGLLLKRRFRKASW